MARVCQVTGKKPQVGHHVSHANNKTIRRFYPNLQYRRFLVESEKRWVRLRTSNAGVRIIDKKGIDAVLKERSEEHTSELQSPCNLVCRLLLEKKKKTHDESLPVPSPAPRFSFRRITHLSTPPAPSTLPITSHQYSAPPRAHLHYCTLDLYTDV